MELSLYFTQATDIFTNIVHSPIPFSISEWVLVSGVSGEWWYVLNLSTLVILLKSSMFQLVHYEASVKLHYKVFHELNIFMSAVVC